MPSVDPELLKTVVTELLKLVLLVIAGLSTYLIKLFADKLKVSITVEQQAALKRIATDAVWYAEEVAAKQKAAGATGETGALKRAYAWRYIKNTAGALVTPEVGERLIHTVLGETQGLGASRTLGAIKRTGGLP